MLAEIRKDPISAAILLFFGLVIGAPMCLIGSFVFSLAVPEIIGYANVFTSRYPNAQLIYEGYDIAGSSERQNKIFVYWTQDQTDEVRRYFDDSWEGFTQAAWPEGFINSCSSKVIATSPEMGTQDFEVCIADANQPLRQNVVLMASHHPDFYHAIDQLPQSGTLIGYTHTIFAP
jgi:hypothetical protein